MLEALGGKTEGSLDKVPRSNQNFTQVIQESLNHRNPGIQKPLISISHVNDCSVLTSLFIFSMFLGYKARQGLILWWNV